MSPTPLVEGRGQEVPDAGGVDVPVIYQGGYIVRFSREPGLTKKGVLNYPFYFQVGPLEEVRFGLTADHAEYTVLARKQLSRPSAKQLMTVQFRAIFLDYVPAWASFSHENFPDSGASDFVTRLRGQLRQMGPIHVCMGTPEYTGRWELDMPMTLRSIEATENAGEPDARYVDVQLTEFDEAELDVRAKGRRRKHGDQTVIVTVYANGVVRPYVRAGSNPFPQDEPQHPGHGVPTLARIAQQVYGTSILWSRIAKANGITGWTANRNLIEYVKKVRGRDLVKLKCPTVKASTGGSGG